VFPAEPVVPLVTPHALPPPVPVAQRPPAPVRRPKHRGTIALAGIAVLVVAALAFPRHPSAPGTDDDAAGASTELEQPADDLVALSPQPPVLPAEPILAPVAASASVVQRAVGAPSKTLPPKPEKNRLVESTKPAAPIAAVTPRAETRSVEDAAAKLPGSEAIAAPASTSVSGGAGGALPVTITGCLEVSVDQAEFRLTDTDGANAPKSRGWRSGFLKKRPAPVALVEPPDRLALQTQVGRRVAATGLLTSRDLKVSALRVVGPSCN
jgi:hypothetical protein